MKAAEIEDWLRSRIAERTQVPVEAIGGEVPFAGFGLDSLSLLTLTGDLAAWLGSDLPVALVWEYPTVAALARRLAQGPPGAAETPRPAPAREGPLPLSLAQEQMWHECHALPDQQPYQIVARFALRGPLREHDLRDALSALIRRHESLRTTFAEVDGHPRQTVHPPAPACLAVRDLSSAPDPEAAAAAAAHAATGEPLDLERGPLFRAALLRLREGDFRLVLMLHHLLGDFHSMRNLYRELSAAYLHREEAAPPRQVADLAARERERLRPGGELYRSHLAWWLAYWAEAPPPAAPYPFRRRRLLTGAAHSPGHALLPIPPEVTSGLRALSLAQGTTLYVVLLAAFTAVLREESGQACETLGTYVSNRPGPEGAEAIGYFINRLFLRADFRGIGTFAEYLARLRETMAEAAAHQELPFAELLRALGEAGKASRRRRFSSTT